ncbi:MFS transporter [Streptomyces sp. NPDC093261]|uniref:MFS transporter n=1 Tax=Streptomyces sp. NPDC093261 TaxID=3366037 RepID=UPI003804B861
MRVFCSQPSISSTPDAARGGHGDPAHGAGATVCAPWSGNLVGRLGPRRPLVLAGGFTAVGGLCMASPGRHTSVPLLLVAYLLLGIGFGFANAPITNTAVSGCRLPGRCGRGHHLNGTPGRLGGRYRHRGGPGRGRRPRRTRRASHPGWLLMTACGLFPFAVARTSEATTQRTRKSA